MPVTTNVTSSCASDFISPVLIYKLCEIGSQGLQVREEIRCHLESPATQILWFQNTHKNLIIIKIKDPKRKLFSC